MEMDHIYGNCANNIKRQRASKTTISTKALIPPVVIGVILLFGVAALGTLTYQYASKLSDEEKKFALLDAQYKNVSADLNDSDIKYGLLDTLYKDLLAICKTSAESSCRACPEGWKHHSGKCYWFSTHKKNWEKSRDYCITLGGHLVIVNSQREQSFLIAQINTIHWIGLNDLVVEGQWRWVDNTSLSQTRAVFWYTRSHLNETDEPDNWKKEDPLGENCACINDGAWQDISCKRMEEFVCETLASN